MIVIDSVGFCASLAVLASFCMTTILPLRLFALTSNVLFIWYGLIGHVYPVLFLHVVLLPVNLIKLYRLQTPPQSETARSGLSVMRGTVCSNDASSIALTARSRQ